MTSKDRLGYDPLESLMENDSSKSEKSDVNKSKSKPVKKEKKGNNASDVLDVMGKCIVRVEGNEARKISLEGEFIIIVVKMIYEKIISVMDSESITEINLNKVTRIDSAGYQALLVLMKYRDMKKLKISVSKEVRSFVKLYGDHELLEVVK